MARVWFYSGHLRFYVVLKRFASSFPENISIYPLFNLIKVEIDESKSDEIQLEIINNKGSYPTPHLSHPLWVNLFQPKPSFHEIRNYLHFHG